MYNIGIIGLGLIGGSIAKCLKNKTNCNIVAMNRSLSSLIEASNDNVISSYSTDDMSIFSNCDIVFICTSVDKITHFVNKLLPFIKKDCIITDVGSTKQNICEDMEALGHINFIGGHPMAGSEKTGYKASKAYLLENAFYILTPNSHVTDDKINYMVSLVKILGAVPLVLEPNTHDYCVAAISHVPHIVASALVNTVANLDSDNKYMHTLAAGGFRDITRIASASPEIWSSICYENKSSILKVLKEFKSNITHIEEFITSSDSLYTFFESAKDYRDSFTSRSTLEVSKQYEIIITVEDKLGVIAKIATLLSAYSINIKNIGIINSREYSDGVLQIIFDDKAHMDKAVTILKDTGHNINYHS